MARRRWRRDSRPAGQPCRSCFRSAAAVLKLLRLAPHARPSERERRRRLTAPQLDLMAKTRQILDSTRLKCSSVSKAGQYLFLTLFLPTASLNDFQTASRLPETWRLPDNYSRQHDDSPKRPDDILTTAWWQPKYWMTTAWHLPDDLPLNTFESIICRNGELSSTMSWVELVVY